MGPQPATQHDENNHAHGPGCAHDHSTCDHDHHHHDHAVDHGPVSDHKMLLAVILTLIFVVGEVVAASIGHSVSLFSDAGHNFADAMALGLSWYAMSVAKRPACAAHTYGYHRVGILAALVNAVSLVVIALVVSYEAVLRLMHPEPVAGGIMMSVAGAAVVVNGVIALWLRHGAMNDLNVRSAYLHMVGDAASSAAVIIAGGVVLFTHNPTADPIVSFIISALILWSSWGILRESVNVLLEASPTGLDMAEVEKTIGLVQGVRAVHDLHVWTVGPGVVACSCHILVDEQAISTGQQVLRQVVTELKQRFQINHTTVQVEVEGCAADDLYCKIQRLGEAHVGHFH